MPLEKMSSQPGQQARKVNDLGAELDAKSAAPAEKSSLQIKSHSRGTIFHDHWWLYAATEARFRGSHSIEADLAFAYLKRERALQLDANHNASQDRNPGVSVSANAASPDKLLESMLGGGEIAVQFENGALYRAGAYPG